MSDPSALLGLVVLAPLVAALVTAVLPDRLVAVAGVLSTLLVAGFSLVLTAVVGAAGPLVHDLAGWDPPVGIPLYADGLSAVFLALTALVGLGVVGYAAADRSATGDDPRFWPLWLAAWAGLNAVYVAGDLFNTYVTLEVVGLAAVALVALGGRASWAPALRYLLVAVLGSLVFLLAVALVYAQVGTLEILAAGERLAAREEGPGSARWAGVLVVVGLGLKAALVPLHAWLPPAHGSAPTAVSAVLSGLVVKAAFFVLVRMWFWVLGPEPALALVVGLLGAAAVLWGGALALVQDRLKQVVAYSTVVQMGYLFLFFPLATAASGDPAAERAAWGGAVALAVGHGFAKAALFLATGTLRRVYGTDSLRELSGVAHPLPPVLMTMGLASVSLAGLPLSLGFAGKWQLVVAALATGQWWWAVLVIGGGLLSAAYLVRPLAVLFREAARDAPAVPALGPAGRRVRYLPLALAVVPLLLGLGAVPLTDLALTGVRAGGPG